MVQGILRSKKKKSSELYDYSKADLKKMIVELGNTEYKGNGYKAMGDIIVSAVKERCTMKCHLFLSLR